MKPHFFHLDGVFQRLTPGLVLSLVLLCIVTTSQASASRFQSTDVRAAQLAAHQALADRVMSLDVGDDTTVLDLVGRSPRVAEGLNEQIKRATLGKPFEHGRQISVEAAVSRDALARALVALGAAGPDHAERLRRGGPDRISAVGVFDRTANPLRPRATPRPSGMGFQPVINTTPEADPTCCKTKPTIARPAPGAFRRYADQPVIPAITPDPAAYLRARRAAEVDALRRLAEQGGEVRVESRSTADGGALTADATHVHVSATLPGVRFGPARDGADGTVEVDAAATLEGGSGPTTTTGTGLVPTKDRP